MEILVVHGFKFKHLFYSELETAKSDVEAAKLQYNLIITLSLGSIEANRVISEPCYNQVTYYRHIAK